MVCKVPAGRKLLAWGNPPFELRAAARPLDPFEAPRRRPQANAALGGLSGHLVVNAWVPDEVDMNKWPLIMPIRRLPLPGLKS
jgi:hypothetical protein